MLDDPTLYVLNKMEEVLQELRVTVERINIYEHKNEIATLPQTMKDADLPRCLITTQIKPPIVPNTAPDAPADTAKSPLYNIIK